MSNYRSKKTFLVKAYFNITSFFSSTTGSSTFSGGSSETSSVNNIFIQIKTVVYIFLLDPPLIPGGGGKNMAKYHVVEKNDWKGMKKGGKCILFLQLVKKWIKKGGDMNSTFNIHPWMKMLSIFPLLNFRDQREEVRKGKEIKGKR